MVATSHGLPDLHLLQGDSYSGTRTSGTASQKDMETLKKFASMSQEVSQLKRAHPSSNSSSNPPPKFSRTAKSNQSSSNSRGSYGSNRGGRNDRKKETLGGKLAALCSTYNVTGTDCNPRCNKKHRCSYMSDGQVCGLAHPMVQHPC